MNKMTFVVTLLFVGCVFMSSVTAQETPREQDSFLYFPQGQINIPLENSTSNLKNIYKIFNRQERVVIIY
jgi:hypothetical protein